MPPKRPIRDLSETLTSKVPKGPLGFFGSGNAIGATGFFLTDTVNTFIPAVDAGYSIESHDIERVDGEEVHTFKIHAASRDVARFVAKYRTSPTNINFIVDSPEVESVEKVRDRRGFTLWRVTTRAEVMGAVKKAEKAVEKASK